MSRLKRYVPPLVPFLFTVPATVVAVRVLVSWYTDSHYTCSPYHPLWSGPLFLWVPCLGVLGLVSGVIFWTPETPRLLRWAGPGFALLLLIWSAWFFLHWFRIDWCI